MLRYRKVVGSTPAASTKQHGGQRTCGRVVAHADVAQLVAHHLAKVRVASSSLVIRSETGLGLRSNQESGDSFSSLMGTPVGGWPAVLVAHAVLAQRPEHPTCNRTVIGSTPIRGS